MLRICTIYAIIRQFHWRKEMAKDKAVKRVVIIGGGIAGLSAASYLLRNGYEVTVLEKHSQCGGLCTSWKRNGYIIDYCVHWLMGSKKGSEFYQIWDELGAFENADGSPVPIVNFDDFTTIWLSTGEKVCLYSDLEKLRQELLRIGPEDTKEIDRFCRSLQKLGTITMKARSEDQTLFGSISGVLKNLGGYLTMMQHLLPMETYAKRFNSAKLRELFLTEIPHDWSLISLTLGLSQQPFKSAGYTVGGSQNLAKNMERVIKELGGTISYYSTVKRILVEHDTAVGVEIADGTKITADYIISAADGHQTLFSMLEGKYLSKEYTLAYETYPLFPSTVFVALGVARDCSDLPHIFSPYFSNPITLIDGSKHNSFSVNVYHYDPTLAPKGKTLITVLLNVWESEPWENLYARDRKAYEQEKDRIAREVIDRLEHLVGDIASHVDMIEVFA